MLFTCIHVICIHHRRHTISSREQRRRSIRAGQRSYFHVSRTTTDRWKIWDLRTILNAVRGMQLSSGKTYLVNRQAQSSNGADGTQNDVHSRPPGSDGLDTGVGDAAQGRMSDVVGSGWYRARGVEARNAWTRGDR
jgi:hypothetical protein